MAKKRENILRDIRKTTTISRIFHCSDSLYVHTSSNYVYRFPGHPLKDYFDLLLAYKETGNVPLSYRKMQTIREA